MVHDRDQLRKTILGRRDLLPPAERREKSRAVAQRLWALPAFDRSANLLAYVNFRSEVETLPIIGQCLARGKEICVPLTLTRERRLAIYRLTDPESDLIPGYCDIPEPDPARLEPVDPHTIDAVLVPGSVFDVQGGRLGYGGGYYDRFFANEAPQAVRIGIAYDLQVVAAVPLEPHDQKLDYLVTETRTIAMKGATP